MRSMYFKYIYIIFLLLTINLGLALAQTKEEAQKHNLEMTYDKSKLSLIAKFNLQRWSLYEKPKMIGNEKVDSEVYRHFRGFLKNQYRAGFYEKLRAPVFDPSTGKDVRKVDFHSFSVGDNHRFKVHFKEDQTIDKISFVFPKKSKESFFHYLDQRFIKIGDKYFERDYSGYLKAYVDKYNNNRADYYFTNSRNTSANHLQKRDQIESRLRYLNKTYSYDSLNIKAVNEIKSAFLDYFKNKDNWRRSFEQKSPTHTKGKIELRYGISGLNYISKWRKNTGAWYYHTDHLLNKEVIKIIGDEGFKQQEGLYVSAVSNKEIAYEFLNIKQKVAFEMDKNGNITFMKYLNRGGSYRPRDLFRSSQSVDFIEWKLKNEIEKKGKYHFSLQYLMVDGELILDELIVKKGWYIDHYAKWQE